MSSPEAKIPKGYYIKARKIDNSEIAYKPPHVREIWDWLIRNANHKDRKCGDTIIRRGQILTSYKQIREGLQWRIGWRKMTYSKWQCESALKLLKKAAMIATQKTTRGIIISLVNYEYYQNPRNYDNHTSATPTTTREPQSADTTHKNEENEKKGKKKKDFSSDSIEYGLAKLLFDLIRLRKPDYREPNLQAWAKHVDYMIRLDHRKPERIEAVIRWCEQDDFWQDNILCTAKLRKQFDQLELKMNKEISNHERNGLSETKQKASKEASSDSQRTRTAISEQNFGGNMLDTEE